MHTYALYVWNLQQSFCKQNQCENDATKNERPARRAIGRLFVFRWLGEHTFGLGDTSADASVADEIGSCTGGANKNFPKSITEVIPISSSDSKT